MSDASAARDRFAAMSESVVAMESCPLLATPEWFARHLAVMNFFTSPMGLQKREMLPRFKDNREYLDRRQALCLSDAEWVRFNAAYDQRRRFDRFHVGIGKRRSTHRRSK